jgi:hypothetical protein
MLAGVCVLLLPRGQRINQRLITHIIVTHIVTHIDEIIVVTITIVSVCACMCGWCVVIAETLLEDGFFKWGGGAGTFLCVCLFMYVSAVWVLGMCV